MLATLIAVALTAQQQPVTLSRVYTAGQKLKYTVKGHLVTETREVGLETYIPDETWLSYDFTLDILKNKADGIVDAKYQRPVMTIQTPDDGGTVKTEKEKMDMIADITLSPINELIDIKDLTPKKKPTKTGGGRWATRTHPALSPAQGDIIGGFLQEMYRLALFMGSIDAALDFQPKLPFDEVEPGATWKRTASYSPQKLESKGGKTVMQRLDYVYTYKGLVDSGNIKVHRVTAELDMNADMLKFLQDAFGKDEEALRNLKEVKFNLKASIDYDLDPKTFLTLKADAKSAGGFKIIIHQLGEPVVDQRITGETTLRPSK